MIIYITKVELQIGEEIRINGEIWNHFPFEDETDFLTFLSELKENSFGNKKEPIIVKNFVVRSKKDTILHSRHEICVERKSLKKEDCKMIGNSESYTII